MSDEDLFSEEEQQEAKLIHNDLEAENQSVVSEGEDADDQVNLEVDDDDIAELEEDLEENEFVESENEEILSEPKAKKSKKSRRNNKLREFIDDEAELSEDGEFSADESDSSDDDDKIDPELVDVNAKELDSDEEEEVRRLYQKQLDSEDRRALLLLKEQLDDNVVTGQRRRKKFHWQARDLMENSLRRHYDPDDDDSQGTDGDDDIDYSELRPRLKRPTAETLLAGTTRVVAPVDDRDQSSVLEWDSDSDSDSEPSISYLRSNRLAHDPEAGPSNAISDDSNSNLLNSRQAHGPARFVTGNRTLDLNRFVFRDKELVQALSTKETVIATREERDRVIQRELKRCLQSKSIFDQLYS